MKPFHTSLENLPKLGYDTFVFRGLPGAGKTYHARNLYQEIKVEILQRTGIFQVGDLRYLSTDDYRIDSQGVYTFDPLKASEYHYRCRGAFLDTLVGDSYLQVVTPIIVDNLNLTMFEVGPFMEMSLAAKRNPILITVQTSVSLALERQQHNVPEFTYREMVKDLHELQVFPDAWATSNIRSDGTVTVFQSPTPPRFE